MPIEGYGGKAGGGVDLTPPPFGIRRIKGYLDDIYQLNFSRALIRTHFSYYF